MRLMRKHICKHRPASPPHRSPTPAIELRHPPLRPAGQRLRQHPKTLRCTLLMRRSSPLHRAPVRIERHRTLQVRRRIPNPHQPAVMQMRKDRSNRPPAARLPRRLSPPSPRIQMRQQMLVHHIIHGVSLNQNDREFASCACTYPRHPTHLRILSELSLARRAATESKNPACLGANSDVERRFLTRVFISKPWNSPGGTTDNSPPLPVAGNTPLTIPCAVGTTEPNDYSL